MSSRSCLLIPLSRIRPTEEVCPKRVVEVTAMINESRIWTLPICIEGTHFALLDGHHRFAAAAALGLSRVPVHVFDYAEVELASWRPGLTPTRQDVVSRALSGQLYPQKTTRHTFVVDAIRPIPIAVLLDGDPEIVEAMDEAPHPAAEVSAAALTQACRAHRELA